MVGEAELAKEVSYIISTHIGATVLEIYELNAVATGVPNDVADLKVIVADDKAARRGERMGEGGQRVRQGLLLLQQHMVLHPRAQCGHKLRERVRG